MLGLARRVEWWLQILVTVCRGIVRRDSGGGLVTGIVLGLARRVEWWLQILVTVCRGIVRRDSGRWFSNRDCVRPGQEGGMVAPDTGHGV